MFLYRIFSILFLPLIALYILLRALRGKEHKKRLKERFAFATLKRPQGEMLWIHAVSVGEANSALIFVDELLKKFPKTTVLFTTTTITSAAVLEPKIKAWQGRVLHQFFPIDSYITAQKFLNYWQPQKIFFVESEIWPNFISVARKMEIATFLVNARMSQKTYSHWLFAKKFGINVFENFAAIFAQSNEDKDRLQNFSSKEIYFLGNLKAQANNLKYEKSELRKIGSEIGPRKFWLAASTHKGEEEIVIEAHKKLKKLFPDILTIIVPRHPYRATEIKALLHGINFSQRSEGQKIAPQTEIYLADSLGEMGLFYGLSDVAFVGGSFANVGGHNPFEAIKLNCVVISGEYVFNFKDIYAKLVENNCCVMVKNVEELSLAAAKFLRSNQEVRSFVDRALEAIKGDDDIAIAT